MSDWRRFQPRPSGARAAETSRPAEWYPSSIKSKFGGFLETRLSVADGTHIAREGDFPEDDGLFRNRCLGKRRHEGGGDGKVGSRFDDPQPPSHIEVDVVDPNGEAASSVENGCNHREPRAVPPHHGTPRGAEQGGCDQSLDLNEHRPGPFHPREHGRAAEMPGIRTGGVFFRLGVRHCASRDKQGRRVRHFAQPAIAHLKDANLVGCAKAVLDRAQYAKLMAALAFEIEDRIHHVLEHPRAGDDTLLRYVTHQDQYKAAPFGEPY